MNADKHPIAAKADKDGDDQPGRFGDGMSDAHRHSERLPRNQRHATLLQWLIAGALFAAAVSIIVILWAFKEQSPGMAREDDTELPTEPEEIAILVKTIYPRCDPSFQMTIEQPAYVEPYFQADLMARVAGPVKNLEVDIGDRVKAGEELVR